MAVPQVNLKQLNINRNQQMALVAVGLAVASVIFTFFFASRLFQVRAHQANVIEGLNAAKEVIDTSGANLEQLDNSFEAFNKEPELLGQKQEDDLVKNSVIILRALPSCYKQLDMINTWRKFLREVGNNSAGYKAEVQFPQTVGDVPNCNTSVGEQAPTADETAPGVEATIRSIPFSLTLTGDKDDLDQMLKDLNALVQPVKILKIQINYPQGDEDSDELNITFDLETYMQPPKNIEFKQDTVAEEQKEQPAEEGADATPTEGSQ